VIVNACEKSTRPLGASRIWITTGIVLVTGAVRMVNEKDVAPARTLSASGTEPATESSLELIASCHPPAGAGALSEPVHATAVPGLGVVEAQLIEGIVAYAMTVSAADCVVPPYVAVIVTVRVGGASTVAMSNDWLVAPAGTVTVAGTVAAASLLDNSTCTSTGAGAVRTTVPVTGSPPGSAVSPRATCCTPSRAIDSVASRVLPVNDSVAVIVAMTGEAVSFVATVNVCDVWPAGIVVCGGTMAAGLLLVIATSSPASGAGAETVTVAATEPPPIVDDGDSVKLWIVARPTVSAVLVEAPAYVAVIVTRPVTDVVPV